MYIGHIHLSVCLSVCVSVRRRMLLLHGPRCNLGELYRGCPVVVQYWADLQSVHEFRYYDNIARTRVSKCLYTRSIPGYTLLTLIRGSTNSCSPILTRRLTLSVTGDDHVSCRRSVATPFFLVAMDNSRMPPATLRA